MDTQAMNPEARDVKAVVASFLERYGAALSANDLDGVASCWEVPALVLSDQGSIAVGSEAQIRAFFGAAGEGYRRRGIMATRPASFEVAELAARVLSVDVIWSALDADGNEASRERSYYLLRFDDGSQPRIRVALSRP